MFKKILKTGVFLFVVSTVFSVANFCFAQDNFGLDIGQQLLLGNTDPRVIIIRIIQIVLGFLGLLAVILIIYAGFLWMTSAGDESKVERAKKIIVNAIIGIIIILSSLAIATYVINKLVQVTGPGGVGDNNNSNNGQAIFGLGGAGVLGACSVESVFPSPNQKNVFRNSTILITFKEEINPSTICANVVDGLCNGGALIVDNVRIYKTAEGKNVYLSDIRVFSTSDRKNFVLSPSQYLGSASENVSYSVYLSGGITTVSGDSVFKNCNSNFMNWDFEVSNNLDLIPPKIKENGVWPSPDEARDEFSDSLSIRATGRIIVASQPVVYSSASISNVVGPQASILADKNSSQSGSLSLLVLEDGIKGKLTNVDTGLSLGVANFNINNEINFPGILTLRTANAVKAGEFWTMKAKAVELADTITIGRDVYVFVSGQASANQISIGANRNATAANISTVVTKHSNVNALVSDNIVSVTAAVAGSDGNNIILKSSNSSSLNVTALSGGFDSNSAITVKGGAKDKPMNSVIKINFNEAIFPGMVVGLAKEVSSRLRVINAVAPTAVNGTACLNDIACRSFNCVNSSCVGDQLDGNFRISNQYKTVEFVSNKQCGANGCGEPIYCLPAGANVRVEIQAASLIPCSSENDCLAKTPYNKCTGGVCRQDNNESYPQANQSSLNGIVDMSFNSLDGNRNNVAVGPVSFYYENLAVVESGDGFAWTFFVSDKMETETPTIVSVSPNLNASGASLNSDIEVVFNKPMSFASLKTGLTEVKSGEDKFIHKNINIWSLSGFPVGYWIESEDVDSNGDGEIDGNKVFIKHSSFGETLDYRAQVGSGVRDAYQNCYKPSSGPGCSANESSPSCCNGSATANLGSDGNCQ